MNILDQYRLYRAIKSELRNGTVQSLDEQVQYGYDFENYAYALQTNGVSLNINANRFISVYGTNYKSARPIYHAIAATQTNPGARMDVKGIIAKKIYDLLAMEYAKTHTK